MTSQNQLTVNNDNKISLNANDIKAYLCPTATDKELFMFIQLCKAQELNPWIREAYLIKYGTGPANIVVGKDVFTKRAMAHPNFAGMSAGIIGEKDGSLNDFTGSIMPSGWSLVGGWAKVFVKGYSEPVEAKVSMLEYGKQQSTWKSMPATMIRKVALVQALREAFPDQLGGLYDSTEMGVNLPASKTDTPIIKKTEFTQEVNPNTGEIFESFAEELPPFEPVISDKIEEEEVKTHKTHIMFGKESGKSYAKLPSRKLDWYKNYFESKLKDPSQDRWKQQNEESLKAIMNELLFREQGRMDNIFYGEHRILEDTI